MKDNSKFLRYSFSCLVFIISGIPSITLAGEDHNRICTYNNGSHPIGRWEAMVLKYPWFNASTTSVFKYKNTLYYSVFARSKSSPDITKQEIYQYDCKHKKASYVQDISMNAVWILSEVVAFDGRFVIWKWRGTQSISAFSDAYIPHIGIIDTKSKWDNKHIYYSNGHFYDADFTKWEAFRVKEMEYNDFFMTWLDNFEPTKIGKWIVDVNIVYKNGEHTTKKYTYNFYNRTLEYQQ